MKRKQTRYNTEAEIIAGIDLQKLKCLANNKEAEECELASQEAARKSAEAEEESNRLTGKLADKAYEKARQLKNECWKQKERARKCRRTARTIEESTLPALKRTLAAFNTTPMVICGEDHGVVLER